MGQSAPKTQLDNEKEIQVITGPDEALFGGTGASIGGIVNLIHEKPQTTHTRRIFDILLTTKNLQQSSHFEVADQRYSALPWPDRQHYSLLL